MSENEREFHDYMKTRRGLVGLIAQYPGYISVETAINAEWLMWNYPC